MMDSKLPTWQWDILIGPPTTEASNQHHACPGLISDPSTQVLTHVINPESNNLLSLIIPPQNAPLRSPTSHLISFHFLNKISPP